MTLISQKPPPTLLFAAVVGIAVLGLYASQPMISALGGALGLGSWANLVTASTLIGYACGLLILVPLIDLLPNRPLILATLLAEAGCLGLAAISPNAWIFLSASFALGLTSSAIQMLVPSAAALATEGTRGQVVGNVMSGLMLGILLSRPIASLLAGLFGWRSFYAVTALLLAAAVLPLFRRLPDRRPASALSYGRLITSMGSLLRGEATLRRRSLYQALLMGAFNVFWTSVALRLAEEPFALGANGIALFALAGAGGAVIAPIAGRAGDRGHERLATMIAHLAVLGALVLAAIAGSGVLPRIWSLGLLVIAAIVLDCGVIADQALGRRAVNLLNPAVRGRVNGLFTGLFFVGGAMGALLSGPAWSFGGWPADCLVGFVCALAAFLLHGAEALRRESPIPPQPCPSFNEP